MTRITGMSGYGYVGVAWNEAPMSHATEFAQALRNAHGVQEIHGVQAHDAEPEDFPADDDAPRAIHDGEAVPLEGGQCLDSNDALVAPEELVEAARAAVRALRARDVASSQRIEHWRGRIANGRWMGLEFELTCRHPVMDCTLHAVDAKQFVALTEALPTFSKELQGILGWTLHMEVVHGR